MVIGVIFVILLAVGVAVLVIRKRNLNAASASGGGYESSYNDNLLWGNYQAPVADPYDPMSGDPVPTNNPSQEYYDPNTQNQVSMVDGSPESYYAAQNSVYTAPEQYNYDQQQDYSYNNQPPQYDANYVQTAPYPMEQTYQGYPPSEYQIPANEPIAADQTVNYAQSANQQQL